MTLVRDPPRPRGSLAKATGENGTNFQALYTYQWETNFGGQYLDSSGGGNGLPRVSDEKYLGLTAKDL